MKAKNLLLSVTVAGLMLGSLTACSAHEHDYGGWIDEVGATCAEAGVKGHYTCDGCGKDFDADYNELDDLTIGTTAHSFTQKTAEDKYLGSPATCYAPAEYYYSCAACGAKGTETFEYGEKAEHTYDTGHWQFDNDSHWHASTCGHELTSSMEGHTLVTSADEAEKTCFCGYTVDLVTSLATPAGFAYANGKITFGAVKFATSYDVEISKGGVAVKTDVSTAAEYDTSALNLAPGKYNISVTANYKQIKSEKASYEFNVLAVDTDVVIEAEDAILNLKHYSNDSSAQGGAYALAFDDCGQGMYFRYYAYEAAEKTVDVKYATANAGSFMKFYVNGAYQKDVVFSENTGWFGEGKRMATASVELNFAQGWNEIYLVKIGTSADTPAYGGYAQIDCIKISGSGKEYDSTQFDLSSTSYKLEAECAQWHWADNKRPAFWGDKFSLGYGLGDMKTGDGFKFTFKVAESGTYKIQLGFGGPDVARSFTVSVNGGEGTSRTYTGSGAWDNVICDEGFTAELTAGEWQTVEFVKADNEWINIDYLLVTRVAD